MKKVISVLLSVLMLVSVSAVSVSAFAETVASQQTTSKKEIIPSGEVNGSSSNDVKYTPDDNDPAKFTFTYTGTGSLEDWEFPGMVEGVDYQIISQDGNSITIQLLNGYSGNVVANAIVEDEEEEEVEKSGKGKSPKTGATAATGIAAAGAGAAILLALRKKEDAE